MLSGQFIGLKEANRALKRLPDFAKDRVQQVMDVTAFQVSQAAKAKAPRDTGRLQQAIGWQSRPRSLSAIAGIDPSAFYWKYLEYGTVKMAARPFWRPAAIAMQADHAARMEQALEMSLTQMERSQ